MRQGEREQILTVLDVCTKRISEETTIVHDVWKTLNYLKDQVKGMPYEDDLSKSDKEGTDL